MRATITAELPDVTVVDETAETIPLANGAVDAVVIGEAFHWFATKAATAEIARALRPDGGIALLWSRGCWLGVDEQAERFASNCTFEAPKYILLRFAVRAQAR